MKTVPSDPVLSAFALPLCRTFYPYGFPLQLETNSSDVIAAAVEGWGAFEQKFDETPMRFCLGVMGRNEDALPLESVIRARGHMMSIVANAGNFAVCDFDRGFGFGWVTEDTAADHPLLRYRFLLSGAASLVEQRAFAPLHGALVARNGIGVMLAGDSFAGKSTLAYACARAGWTYISDDAAFMVQGRQDRFAVGDPHSIRFRPDAPRLFPELGDRMPSIRPNGKIAIEIFTRELKLQTAADCHIDHIIYLNRVSAGPVNLSRLSTGRVRDDLSQFCAYGLEETHKAQRACYEYLLNADIWEVQYSDLDSAIARIERLVDTGA